jgi:hypothetical protein
MTTSGGASDPGDDLDGGASGASDEPTCMTPHAGQLRYEDFDTALTGPLFPDAVVNSTVTTTLGTTCTVTRDPTVGNTCAGALHVSAGFQGYAALDAPNEKAFGQIDFALTDWSDGAALHVKVKVQPSNAPVTGVRLFLLSGADYAYDSIFDGRSFKAGDWYELVFPFSGTPLDLTVVRRVGVAIILNRAEAADAAVAPPTVEIWLDDIWLEPG